MILAWLCRFKGTPWDENFNFVNFEKLFYMKPNLLILTEWIKKSKKEWNSFFPGRVLPCKQNKSAVYSVSYHIFPRLRRWDQSSRR